MCLGVPGVVVEIAGAQAVVDFRGVRRKVALDIVDEPVVPGNHVLVHVGFAIRRNRARGPRRHARVLRGHDRRGR